MHFAISARHGGAWPSLWRVEKPTRGLKWALLSFGRRWRRYYGREPQFLGITQMTRVYGRCKIHGVGPACSEPGVRTAALGGTTYDP